jgi:[acyl-carrier-protein] S-malonyltransferase
MSLESLALLLPGQGAQVVGMGSELAIAVPEARRVYEEADDVLGVSLSRLCWEGPIEELTRTENAQPAILLHSYATWISLPEEIRERATVAAGHSLGEFTAYLLAGTFSFPDALRLVRRRGELMARSGDERPGTMAAIIGLTPEAVEAICVSVSDGIVVPANFNAPGQVVISGDVPAVDRARELALQAGAKRALPLNVSGAFHSPLMEGARDGLAEALEGVTLSDPSFPVVANAAARPVTTAAEAAELLVVQLTSPVRWVECVEEMRRTSPSGWLELGPNRVLTGLMRRIDRGLSVTAAGSPDSIVDLIKAVDDG